MVRYSIGKVKNRVGRALFEWRCEGIRSLPPIQLRPGPVTLISLVSGRDVTLYLFALRSFYRFLPGAGVVVVDDGSLSDSGRATIAASVPGVEFVGLSSIETGACPRGACWERLCEVLDRCRLGYVIQMDSDTVCLREPLEVLQAIKENRPCLRGTGNGRSIGPVSEASALAKLMASGHVQPAAERLLETLDGAASLRYVRACAAFAGFAQGGASRADAGRFSAAMAEKLGTRWTEWGTEQVTSNFLLANMPGAAVLPFPKYASVEPGLALDDCAVIHFLGTWRWNAGRYRRFAAKLLDEWRREA
jgi:hypothetical protein